MHWNICDPPLDKINKPFKKLSLDQALKAEDLNELTLKDIWKLSFSNDQLNKNLLKEGLVLWGLYCSA